VLGASKSFRLLILPRFVFAFAAFLFQALDVIAVQRLMQPSPKRLIQVMHPNQVNHVGKFMAPACGEFELKKVLLD
jgi:hypothetical protein